MAAATPQRRGAGGLGGALRSGLPPGGRRGAHRRLPWCAALLGPAQAGLTPFPSDPVQEGCARFQQDVFIAEQYLERDDGACSSIRGPQCQGLHGRPKGPAPAGIFSLFGTLPGDPGFFVQDEAGPYFASPVREQDEAEAEEEELLEGAAPAAPGGAAAEGPAPAARSLRLAFGGLRPELERLPRWLNLTSDLAVEAVGSFALVPASLAGVSNTTEVDGRPRVFAEVQDAVAYLRFTEPVTVDRLWLSRQDEPPDGELALPIVLRGRNGPDEQWSAYLRHGDLQAGRATPLSVAPLVVNEVVMIGCRGLLIASLRVSQLIGRADAAGSPQGGWLAAPAKRRLRSLRDVAVSRLPLPSAAPLLSVSEIHRMGHFRLRSELFEDGAAAEEPELSGEGPPGEAAEEGSTAEHREFSDARTVGVARAFLDAVVTGALAIPPDLPLAQLEADSRLYAEAFGQVTIEEAVNARGLDELYERLFTANRMDVLDLLFLHFMWSNHTGQLRAPGGTVRDRPLPSSPAPAAASSQPAAAASASAAAEASLEKNTSSPLVAGKPAVFTAVASRDWADASNSSEANATEASLLLAQDAAGRRMRGVVARLRRFTSIYARWKRPMEEKLAIFNATGASDVTFTLYENRSWLGVDYYNAASGRSRRVELEVPDSEYLLAELLAVEGELLVDRRGRPLPEARAAKAHAQRTYLQAFEEVLLELRRSTADTDEPPLDEAGDVLVTEANASQSSDGVGHLVSDVGPEAPSAPPLAVAVGVPCLVVTVVLAVALAPPLEPRPGRPPLRAAVWAGRLASWLVCANAAIERLEARLGFARLPDAAPRHPEQTPPAEG